MKAIFELSPSFKKTVPEIQHFDQLMMLEGELVRSAQRRETLRCQLGGQFYYIKRHQGIGWREYFKELGNIHRPITSAMNEQRAIEAVHQCGLATMVCAAYGERGQSPVALESFIVTESLEGTINLEQLCTDWSKHAPNLKTKRWLLRRVAAIAKQMHDAGINHRDFYLCHFQLDENFEGLLDRCQPPIYLMDLHRAQLRIKVPLRWRVKDIAALYFSAIDIGLSRRDMLRFVRVYTGKPLKESKGFKDRLFWRVVNRRAAKFYRRDFGASLPKLD